MNFLFCHFLRFALFPTFELSGEKVKPVDSLMMSGHGLHTTMKWQGTIEANQSLMEGDHSNEVLIV